MDSKILQVNDIRTDSGNIPEYSQRELNQIAPQSKVKFNVLIIFFILILRIHFLTQKSKIVSQ